MADAIRSLLQADKNIIVLAQLTSVAAAGKVTASFKVADLGFDAFTIEVLAVAGGAAGPDTLLVGLCGSIDGTIFTDTLNRAANATVRTIPNVITEADYTVLTFVNVPFHSVKIGFASSGANETWTVDVRVRRVRLRNGG